MAEPVLNSPRIVAVIRQLIAAGVAQHVDVDRGNGIPARAPMRLIIRLTASVVNGPPRSVAKTWRLSVSALSLCKARSSSPRMGCAAGVLGAPYVQRGIPPELHLRPFQIANLDGP
jgi:hypothetical protein